MGTSVAAGAARAEVVATGMKTELGRIAHLLAGATDTTTPLQTRLARVSRTLLHPVPRDRRRRRGARFCPRPAAAGGVHVGGVAGGCRGARGPAGDRHHRARDRCPADGGAPRSRSPAAGRRDAGQRDGHLHRQDRHADDGRDDRARAVGAESPRAAGGRRRVLRRRAGRGRTHRHRRSRPSSRCSRRPPSAASTGERSRRSARGGT